MNINEVAKVVFATCELDEKTWYVDREEPHSDWDHIYWFWIKGYLIDDDGKINSWATQTRKNSFFYEPLNKTWLHFNNGKSIHDISNIDYFGDNPVFEKLESLVIPNKMKEKLVFLANKIDNSMLVKEEFAKPYYT